jgi:hypothetical protein
MNVSLNQQNFMQIIKSIFKLVVFICPFAAKAQSTYLPQGDKGYHFVDRLEIKQQTNTDLNFSTLKPYNRKYIVQQAEYIDSLRKQSSNSLVVEQTDHLKFTKVDEYNMNSLLMNNSEWVTGSKESFLSKKPVWGAFYKTKPNLLEVNVKDFFLVVNPVLQFNLSKESGNSERIFLNTRGITARGMIARKLGFVTTITDNQERGPLFFQQYIGGARAVPGAGYYKAFKGTGVDYFDARGYITFNAAKYIDIQFGYDKNFIGNGYRSLFLSDWGNSNLFLKLNTRIWKLNYQNLFMELMPQFVKNGDNLLDRKYAAMHHLSMNVTKWLNVGVFESIIFGRRNHFDFEYLNPIIFLRHIESTVGSPDNALLGGDFKANIAHKVQVYGQLLLDEFVLGKIKENRGWWANKYGTQLGIKYIDAFGIANLDLQAETNRVRPYTYSHNDSVSNYSHYNQPLAHPLGANFNEFIGIARYQPLPKIFVLAKLIYYKKGLDSLGYNAGGNIFRLDTDRYGIEEGYTVGGGKKATCINALLQVSYELRENLFFDLSYQRRSFKVVNTPTQDNSMSLITAGVRLNIAKRQYDF